jgi:hypothetical protein
MGCCVKKYRTATAAGISMSARRVADMQERRLASVSAADRQAVLRALWRDSYRERIDDDSQT